MLGDLTITELNEGLLLLVSIIGGATAIGKFYSNSMKKVIKEQSLEDEQKINNKFDEINLNINRVKQDVEKLSTEVKSVKKDVNMVMKTEHIMLKHIVKKNSTSEMGNVLDEFDEYIIERK